MKGDLAKLFLGTGPLGIGIKIVIYLIEWGPFLPLILDAIILILAGLYLILEAFRNLWGDILALSERIERKFMKR